MQTRLAGIVSKIVKRVSYIIFTSYVWDVCLQHKRKLVGADAMLPTARSINSSIQTVLDASFRFVRIRDLCKDWRWTFRSCSVKISVVVKDLRFEDKDKTAKGSSVFRMQIHNTYFLLISVIWTQLHTQVYIKQWSWRHETNNLVSILQLHSA